MKRLTNLRNILKEKNIDGILITSASNITYLTGFTGDSSRLMVSELGTVLITDGRYAEQAANECHKEINIIQWLQNKRYSAETYNHVAERFGIKTMAFESHVSTFAEYDTLRNGLKNISLVPLASAVETLRQIKDAYEIECLKRACEISDKSLELTIPFIKEGITEIELAARLEFHMKTSGAENISFETIVLSGTKTSLLHGKPGEKKLEKGDFVLFDFGALYKGYHADISRTFILGQANDKQREIYNIIRKAQKEAIQSLKPGIPGKMPDQVVRNIIPPEYIGYYYQGLGHGVGLQIHEEPFMGQVYDSYLAKNMVVTIEPGIYIPGWGGLRIEDTVVIYNDSIESLTKFPRDLQIL
jgi:Xaa-Pro aminopeptidase